MDRWLRLSHPCAIHFESGRDVGYPWIVMVWMKLKRRERAGGKRLSAVSVPQYPLRPAWPFNLFTESSLSGLRWFNLHALATSWAQSVLLLCLSPSFRF
jgi:hypothetical protein